jgi:hypothetical protein
MKRRLEANIFEMPQRRPHKTSIRGGQTANSLYLSLGYHPVEEDAGWLGTLPGLVIRKGLALIDRQLHARASLLRPR